MTELQMLAIVLAIAAVYNLNTLRRLAPLLSEALLKSALALLFWAGYFWMAWRGVPLAGWLEPLLFSLAAIFSLSTAIVFTLGRLGWYALAENFIQIFYWTPVGRQPFYALLMQMTLQQEKHEQAQHLADKLEDGTGSTLALQAQICVLQARWHEVLALQVPTEGVQRAPLLAAQVEAALAVGEVAQAEAHVESLAAEVEKHKNMPSYRAYRLSEVRLLAAKGNLDALRQRLAEGIPNTARHTLLAILAQGAENAGDNVLAQHCYRDAYIQAPKAVEARFAAKIEGDMPKKRGSSPSYGTYGLFALIALCFVLQLVVGNTRAWIMAAFNASFEMSNGTSTQVISVPNHWWRYLSYAFVHGGFIHAAMNLWVLIDIGRLYERRRRWANLLMSFVFGAVMGSYITSIAQGGQAVGLVGASGGILGIGGALLADVWRREDARDALLLRALLQWIAFISIFSLAIPMVSFWGHIGGIVGGLLWGFIRQGISHSMGTTNQPAEDIRVDSAIGVAALLALAITFIAMLLYAQEQGLLFL